jgi:hypothetical protein
MSEPSLDVFGRLLITRVRDETISDWDMIVAGRMKGERALKLRQLLDMFSDEQRRAFLSLVPSIVDTVLHHLLWMFDQEEDVQLGMNVGDRQIQNLKDISDGLVGELYSDEGWIARFSKHS